MCIVRPSRCLFLRGGRVSEDCLDFQGGGKGGNMWKEELLCVENKQEGIEISCSKIELQKKEFIRGISASDYIYEYTRDLSSLLFLLLFPSLFICTADSFFIKMD